jgi:DNA adenine methylase
LGEHFGGRKPPLSYYGGKQRMAHRIIPLIPRHTVYVEPFAGGAAVFFGKPWPDVANTHHYREVLNDHDERIVNFYRQLRDNGEELTHRLSLTPYSEAEHQVAKRLDYDDPMTAAVRYFVNGQQSFANKLNAGWGRSVYTRNWGATWANGVARLPEYLDRMAGVHLACADALKVIKEWDSPQTFFYCDPPYPGTDCGHYKGYTVDDLQRLVDALDACQGSFVLSNYDQPGVMFPSGWERIEFNSKMSASKDKSAPKERTEVAWRRMARMEPREEIKALYASGRYDCFKGDQQGLF